MAGLTLKLTAKSTALRTSLPESIVRALSDLVRSMNCYYSNLIEGHDTHPIDIERALNEDEVRAGRLPEKSGLILETVLYRGELPRGEMANILGTGDRHSRRATSVLMEKGVLMSTSTRAPLLLSFPATLAARWMPRLFPER